MYRSGDILERTRAQPQFKSWGVLGVEGIEVGRRRHREREAEGVEGLGNAEGASPPQPTRGLGSVVRFPSRVRGGDVAENEFCTI